MACQINGIIVTVKSYPVFIALFSHIREKRYGSKMLNSQQGCMTMKGFIISGVGPGMGCSIVREFVSHGMAVGIVSRSDFGSKLAKELGIHHAKFDLKNYEATERGISELVDKLGGIDGIVHSAGGFFSKESVLSFTNEQFREALENNAMTFFNMVKSSVPHLKEKGGSITAISAARNVYYGSNPGYSAGKGAIVHMVRTFAKDLGRFNIRVNSIAPGFIRKDDCGDLNQSVKLLGMERYPSSFIGNIVFSVATNNIMTGQNIEADGGVSSQI